MNWQNDLNWIDDDVVLAVHEAQLAEHGGETGLRDLGLLESALFRPKNAAMYGSPTVPELAALYALGITGNHPFVDGNKRVATVLLETFLEDNGFVLQADDRDLYEAIFALSNGKLGEQTFTEWVGQHALQTPPNLQIVN